MRFTGVFLLVFLVVTVYSVTDAATYQTIEGRSVPLKRNDGSAHPRRGELGPGDNLRWADLADANLQRADLKFADLRNANFEGANLFGATLRRAAVGGAGFGGANLNQCDLSGAQLDGADFRGARNWKDAKWKDASYHRGVEPRWPEGFCPKSAGVQQQDPHQRK